MCSGLGYELKAKNVEYGAENSWTAWQEYTLLLLLGKVVATDWNGLPGLSSTHRNN